MCEISVVPYYDGHLMVRDCNMFDKVFWIFLPYVEAFKHCKPFFLIDGTYLYEKYGGVLLIAVAQNGNRNILPIAFTIVESQAIKVALRVEDNGWHPLRAVHAYCVRHMAANFMFHFQSANEKMYLINAAYSLSKAGYK
ncbi:uncharacterized protein [Arachis hypogaea]|uniref:uncharacterized protein n=1 Tax=Arachis hypogaea TaxID=3818 RepID=UPI000DEC23D3|nr:uncharacterized protein LOC112723132 [Arachis hypogaea]